MTGEETRKRRAVASLGDAIVGYTPLEEAAKFHKSIRTAKYRFYFGGNRSGKSEANIGFDLCSFALGAHPFRTTPAKAVIWACADTWEMVGKLLWGEKIKRYLPARHIQTIHWHNKGADIPREIRLRSGVSIEFKAFQQGRELFQGRPIDACYVDEQCTRDSEQIFQEIQARLIDKEGFFAQSATPIKPQPWLEERVVSDLATDAAFYANLTNNSRAYKYTLCDWPGIGADIQLHGHLPHDEIQAMINEWPEEVQTTRVEGKFASFYGVVYKSFSRQIHVIEPFAIPDDWERWRSIDWGFNNPFVCIWMARDHDNRFYVYAEHYRNQQTLEQQADVIKRISGSEHYRCTYADHDAQDRAEFVKMGIMTRGARKDIRGGIEAVQRCLKVQGDGKPRLFFFNTCRHSITEHSAYHYPEGTDLRDPKDEPVKKDDHTCDAIRYLIYGIEGPRAGVIIPRVA